MPKQFESVAELQEYIEDAPENREVVNLTWAAENLHRLTGENTIFLMQRFWELPRPGTLVSNAASCQCFTRYDHPQSSWMNQLAWINAVAGNDKAKLDLMVGSRVVPGWINHNRKASKTTIGSYNHAVEHDYVFFWNYVHALWMHNLIKDNQSDDCVLAVKSLIYKPRKMEFYLHGGKTRLLDMTMSNIETYGNMIGAFLAQAEELVWNPSHDVAEKYLRENVLEGCPEDLIRPFQNAYFKYRQYVQEQDSSEWGVVMKTSHDNQRKRLKMDQTTEILLIRPSGSDEDPFEVVGFPQSDDLQTVPLMKFYRTNKLQVTHYLKTQECKWKTEIEKLLDIGAEDYNKVPELEKKNEE